MKNIKLTLNVTPHQAVGLWHLLNGSGPCFNAYKEVYKARHNEDNRILSLIDQTQLTPVWEQINSQLGQEGINPSRPDKWQDIMVGEYTATFSDDGTRVRIGCQTIPIDQVRAVLARMEEIQKGEK